jgi:phosphoserine phosphatase RsbU/P
MAITAIDPQDIVLRLEMRLIEKQNQMTSLLEITTAINNNLSEEGLFNLYEIILKNKLGLKRWAVFTYDGYWHCKNLHGVSKQLFSSEYLVEFVSKIKQITFLNNPAHKKVADIFQVAIPVYHKDHPLAVVLLGILPDDNINTVDDKLNYIQTITNVICVAIENKRLVNQSKKQDKLLSDMKLAGEVQTQLMPDVLPNTSFLQMAGLYLPNHEIGGDYYDYIPLNEDEFIFCIGDISGNGVAAALLMANFQAALSADADSSVTLETLIQTLNKKVNEITGGEYYITLFLAKYNLKTRELIYVNAGHPHPLLYSENMFHHLGEGSTILGIFEHLPQVNVQKIKIAPNAVLFSFTDGLIELENSKDQPYGMDILESIISGGDYKSMKDLNKKILITAKEFTGKSTFSDDISFLSCRFF